MLLALSILTGLAGAVGAAWFVAVMLDRQAAATPKTLTAAAAANVLVAYAYPALLRIDRARGLRIAADAAGDARCASTLVKDATAHLSDAPATAYPAEREALRVLIAKHDLLHALSRAARPTPAQIADLASRYEAAGYVRYGDGEVAA